MKTLILCDFDGTISVEDMGYVLLTRFSAGDWEAIDRQFCVGKQAGVDVYALPTGIHCKNELSRGRPKRILSNLKELLLLVRESKHSSNKS